MNIDQPPVTLTPELLIGSGSERDCYRHPLQPALCIKISHGKFAHKKPAKQNQIEYRYYQRFRHKAQHWELVPTCHGWINTNLGQGLVFDLVSNDDGSIAAPLLNALENDQINADQARALLSELKGFLLQEVVVPNELRPGNIVVQHIGGRQRLMLIDGIGSRDLVKFAEAIPLLGRMKIQRNWTRLAEKISSARPDLFSAQDLV